jgi:DASS family divalent anion:Na+ symporter
VPEGEHVGWGLWALAAAPITLGTLIVAGVAVFVHCRPPADRPLHTDVIVARLRALGPASRRELLVGTATAGILVGLPVAAVVGIDPVWPAAGALVVAAGDRVFARDRRSPLDLPLLLFLGVVLSLPAIIRHAGIDARLGDALRATCAWCGGEPVSAVAILFLLTVVVRLVISEWVCVPMMVLALLPAAGMLSLHPWVIVFVVLLGANTWIFPYQFSTYLAFWGGSEGRLWAHRQVRPWALGYLLVSLVLLLVSVPLWRALDLIR